MQPLDFQASLQASQPPAAWPPLVQAMWWDTKGDWERAHTVAQEVDSADGAWVHAYLHRREGDLGNAGYWYRLAGRPVAKGSLDQERALILTELLIRDTA